MLVSSCIAANRPNTIIIPDNMSIMMKSALEEFCHDSFTDAFVIEAIPRRLFSGEEVDILMDKYVLEPASLKNYLMDKNCCRSAVSGLFRHLQTNFFNFLVHPILFSIWQYQKRLFIDSKTSHKYSLDMSPNSQNKANTLFRCLDYTKTNLGTMFLKQHILQPLIDKKEILQRLDGVEELMLSNDQYCQLGDSLTKLSKFGFEMLKKCVSLAHFKRLSDIEYDIQALIDLTSSICELKVIIKILSTLKSPIFNQIKRVLYIFP